MSVIDLHVHSEASDGKFSAGEILQEAARRKIKYLSITDHDSIGCQEKAVNLARKRGIHYLCGVELNVTFSHPSCHAGKSVALDFLGYQFDSSDAKLNRRLQELAEYREARAAKILENLNRAFEDEGITKLTQEDFKLIQESADGVLGRPHIADYLVRKGIVKSRQEAFDRYLVKFNVPKFPLPLEEASKLVRDAGGKLVLAHPNDPHGTSLVTLTKSLSEQTELIEESMLSYIDGVECWHSRNDQLTTSHYMNFAKEKKLLMTGGSDCHQKPVIMGTTKVPEWVTSQFSFL